MLKIEVTINLLMQLTTQFHQLELPRNLCSPWFSLALTGFVGCLEVFVENKSDKELVDVFDNPVSSG